MKHKVTEILLNAVVLIMAYSGIVVIFSGFTATEVAINEVILGSVSIVASLRLLKFIYRK